MSMARLKTLVQKALAVSDEVIIVATEAHAVVFLNLINPYPNHTILAISRGPRTTTPCPLSMLALIARSSLPSTLSGEAGVYSHIANGWP